MAADHEDSGVALDAPQEWLRPIGGAYQASPIAAPDAPVRIRHSIGRAIKTSAGPRLDISGEQATNSGARELLGAEALTRGRPSLLVLQAEPTPDDGGVGQEDDLVEKLALAADVLASRADLDVLIVPAIPSRMTAAVAQAIAQHAATPPRGDPRVLQSELRRLLRPEVVPVVLDDLVLFANSERHK